MLRHHLIVLRVVRSLDLLDEQIDQVEQVDLVPLLVCGVIQIDVDLEVGLLEDKLDEHALLLHVLLVQLLQL